MSLHGEVSRLVTLALRGIKWRCCRWRLVSNWFGSQGSSCVATLGWYVATPLGFRNWFPG